MRLCLLFCWIGILTADVLTVTVYCSNGQAVPNLPIDVFDSEYQVVPGITQTDSEGVFVIEDVEDYPAPFYLFFTAKNGSTCGSYSIQEGLDPSIGSVQLPYYPTGLPCSCANLFD